MPTYTFHNKKSGKIWTDLITIAEMEELLAKDPNIEQVVAAPNIVDPWSVGRNKVPSGFRNVLQKVKKNNKGAHIDTKNISEI